MVRSRILRDFMNLATRYWPEKCSVSIEWSVKSNTNADIFMPTSVPLEGEQVVPKVTPEGTPVPPEPERPTVLALSVVRPTTTFVDNPIIDHLGNNFKHAPLDQGHPRHICTESAAIRHL
jgi:hypothetical protein